MCWRGCVGAMYWFLMMSTMYRSGVGMVVGPMIKAHVTSVSVHGAVETASRTSGDTDATGTTGAITTSRAAIPIDTVIRVATAKAPTLPYLIVVPLPARLLDAWVSCLEQA